MKSLSLCFLIFGSLIVFPHSVRATLEATSERDHMENAMGLASKQHVRNCISELRKFFAAEVARLEAQINDLNRAVEEQLPFGRWLDLAVKKRGIALEDCILSLDLAPKDRESLLGRFRQRATEEVATVPVETRNSVLRFLARYDEHVVFITNLKLRMKAFSNEQLKMALALVGTRGVEFPEQEVDQLIKALAGKDITYIPSSPFGNALERALAILEFNPQGAK
jgi:hypothetical protein